MGFKNTLIPSIIILILSLLLPFVVPFVAAGYTSSLSVGSTKLVVNVPPPPPGYEKYAGRWSIAKGVEVSEGPVPYPYKHLGAETNYGKNTGIIAQIYVTDPEVPHDGSYDYFFYSWVMIYNNARDKWIQVGWSEVSWRDNRQYVTVYDTEANQWYFFPEYSLTIGSCYYFAINYQGNGKWAAWIWWDNEWKLLRIANIEVYSAELTGQFCEVYSRPEIWFNVPNTRFYPTYLLIDNQWQLWTTAYPTTEYNSNPPYYVHWSNRYYDWYMYKEV